MKDKVLLVTGGAGFIGSNYIIYLLKTYSTVKIVNIDKLTYAGELSNLDEIASNDRYTFIKGDICDRQIIESLFNSYDFDGVIHFAAESHVDNSIEAPDEFIRTNIFGTFNVLDVAKNHWMDGPFKFKKGKTSNRFHHISTDEVYGTLGETGLFTEETPYAPNSPYSASKASSDFIVRSYFHTYGMNVVTTNCSNNYGPKQHDEKLIPTIIRKAISGENIPIYGDGLNIRDWLYVEDHCSGIDLTFQNGQSGETYNIGGKNERNNLYIANTICEILDEVMPKPEPYKNQITFVKDRPGHDFRYAIDASKIEGELQWQANENFESGIRKTINWYIRKYKAL
ncbi:MAG: dTDP-glucose 4,6-dehydratase [Bacteroidia bacterium]|nr:dTDP-glucose 4,6-dehydratase [Bacteroidia bacterium]MBT8278669.1 dTDP-glucose 4,6-dehydratase [Bacteroidia bacterium]NND25734.1 dTDP-glucose 4,6-dehydratase [Flavobacteriaceae bacterium]NNK59736.1 dTDP-glucose 4,6-dehydratase [Flavobacteriaceae bacterium]RZW55620.1 MAG: dTDP-glucose 4,6-dehydratase [Flavobacteriaceae bacterium]